MPWMESVGNKDVLWKMETKMTLIHRIWVETISISGTNKEKRGSGDFDIQKS